MVTADGGPPCFIVRKLRTIQIRLMPTHARDVLQLLADLHNSDLELDSIKKRMHLTSPKFCKTLRRAKEFNLIKSKSVHVDELVHKLLCDKHSFLQPTICMSLRPSTASYHEAREKALAIRESECTGFQLIQDIADALEVGSKAFLFTGAGISVSAGIPLFRGDQGIYKQGLGVDGFAPKYAFASPHTAPSVEYFRQFLKFHGNLWEMSHRASPTFFHRIIKDLYDDGLVGRVWDQNIDMLFEKVGLPRSVLESVHGSYSKVCCLIGHQRNATPEVCAAMKLGDIDQLLCSEKHGTNSRTVECGNYLVPGIRYNDVRQTTDYSDIVKRDIKLTKYLLIVVGSSLEIEMFRNLISAYMKPGISLYVVGPEEPVYSGFFENWNYIKCSADKFALELYRALARPRKSTQRTHAFVRDTVIG
eukprot:Partr_v1_DN25389_c4_g3_i1_m21501 putative NAD-dependent lysine demalonylase and desuccinylase that specifically removes malonyl and succinyl groups on target proteins. Has weak NAD-dependent protein deacetylase activity